MAKELPYFKFNVAEFLLGGILSETDAVIGMFYKACAHYWHKECELTRDELVKKIGAKRVDLLISKEYIKENEGFVFIEFLDEQRIELSKTKTVNSNNGSKGAKVRWAKKNSEAIISPIANEWHLDKDKIKIREDKDKINAIDFREIFFNDLENSQDFESICRNLQIEPDFLKTFIPGFRVKAELKYPSFDRFVSHFKNYVTKEITNATKQNTKTGDRLSRQESVGKLEELSLAVLRANDGTNG